MHLSISHSPLPDRVAEKSVFLPYASPTTLASIAQQGNRVHQMQNSNDSGKRFKFRRNAKIGEPGAEFDDEFLFQSFVDVGDYGELRNTKNPARIVVGRTGSGKTALLRLLQKREEHVIAIEPQNLSLNYIANNDVIRFFDEIGVKLDLFYTLLWRHVFAVELLKTRYGLTTAEKTESFFSSLVSAFHKKDQSKERAIKYLKDWGEKFWIETEYRIKELTNKLASELKAEIGTDIPYLKGNLSATSNMSAEEKQEVVYRGQQVVNQVQLKELSEVIGYLNDEAFTDDKRPYFITIDSLDEEWIDDSLRFKLIRALLETVKAFQRVQNVKIIVALRQDLIQKVLSVGRDIGFQDEKYQSLILKIRWNRSQIETLLDNRIALLVRQQYTQRPVKLKELFPERIGRLTFIDYLLQRIAMRPRDAILFINECIGRSEERGEVRVQTVYDAEKAYSISRRDALISEWASVFPSLSAILPILEHAAAQFPVSALAKSAVDEAIQKAADMTGDDAAIRASKIYLEVADGNRNTVLAEFTLVLFSVGAISLRLEGGAGPISAPDSPAPSPSQIKSSTKVMVHPMLHQALHTVFH